MAANGLEDILLEEVELSDDERFWYVTLSALIPEPKKSDESNPAPVGLAAALAQASILRQERRRRIYRVFKINADTGAVQSMKIREAA